ncbi:DUF302 domain-containing protein [Sulfitobacter delicatus]|uniref:Uncharacterized conserved protein, DUF302 family n=1 Tax=Sulfitobacter delicatus TaxID=218672 RepID=A0A1G7WDM3_9RHOB|nr:DUF302 domain-containing protein [Sulfitobacter delicatus]SDG70036.1 Uncharacterized conserved protein, DUF302 family [Sulfitobacter delicatus]
MYRFILVTAAFVASAAQAEEMVTYTTDQSFDDVTFGVENAILNQGLITENVSHVGEMLDRTGADVGSDVKVFEAADVFSFCSASLSRKVMEADPMNVGFCPYDIFVMQLPDGDEVTVGYRAFPEGPMQEVQSLLDAIVKEAIGE